jgi:hypothetical protein
VISAARRRELVDELVAERSRIVLREDEREEPAESVMWPLGLIAVLAGGHRVHGRGRRTLALTVALVGLAWLEAFEVQEEPAPRSGGDRGAGELG